MSLKTHKVLDLNYHPEEGQGCFDGTQQECEAFVAKQSPHFMYKVVPMTDDEINNHPDNKLFFKASQSCMEFYRKFHGE